MQNFRCDFVSGLVGIPSSIQWSNDVISCPNKGLVVIETAFYEDPLAEVCDSKCRMGPEASAHSCYFRRGTCVQKASENDVSAVYDTCDSVATPTMCLLTKSGLRKSLLVGFSCIERTILRDPFNNTFGWKDQEFAFAFNQTSPPPTPSVTECDVSSEIGRPSFKITTLKPPPFHSQNHSVGNDITIVVDDVRKSVEVSLFPQWLMLNASHFSVQFTMGDSVLGYEHPFWIMLEDDQNPFEVKCRHTNLPTSSSTTAIPIPDVTARDEPSNHLIGQFTLRDLVVAVVVAVIAVAAIALLVCLLLRRRKRQEEPDIYSTLSPLVHFDNTGSDGVATVLGSQQNGRESRGPCPAPPTSCHPEYQPSDRLPPGTGLSNESYGHRFDMGGNSDHRRPCSTDDSYLAPICSQGGNPEQHVGGCAGGFADEKRKVYENTEYDEIPAVPSKKE
ncbi:hypothetical protein V1264_016684 [Littorina saxatilis]|uniref:Uncharacterized protein n=1 Tax=Littorina saxatilis TaxID=31220 RepID=A0AAN9BL54_9CAEN